MSKKESNAAPDIARPVPPPAPPARALSCVTHHHACDCREAEWAQKMAAQQLRIEGLERLLADRWENLNCLDNEIDMKNARIEELEHYNVGLATESVAQQSRIAELEARIEELEAGNN